MTNKDAWDEALLNPPPPLPTAPIAKSLVPVAGLLIALLVVTGVEAAGKISLPSLPTLNWPTAPSLAQFKSFSLPTTDLKTSLAAVGEIGKQISLQAAAGIGLSGDLLATGYNNLGEASFLLTLNAVNNLSNGLSTSLTAGRNLGQTGLSAGGKNLKTVNGLMLGAAGTIDSQLASVPPAAGLVAASAAVSVGEWAQAITDDLTWWVDNARDFLFAYGQAVGERWQAFLAGRAAPVVTTSASSATPVPVTLDLETKNDLKDIKAGVAEILKRLDQNTVAPTGKLPSQGLVVVPKVDSTNSSNLQARVGSVFSDQVQVSLDASGKAGVVTPVFRRGPGDNYLFLLTPVTP